MSGNSLTSYFEYFDGAVGQQYFQYYDLDNAEAITITGQLVIRWIEKRMNRYLNTVISSDIEKDRIVAIDTDSVVGESLINVDSKNISIEDFYDSCSKKTDARFMKNDTFNKDFVVDLSEENYKSLSFNTFTRLVEQRKINYIMKHKVKKRLFKVVCNGKSVIVTEDHSIIIINKNNKILSVKPQDIESSDSLIMINTIDTDSIRNDLNENREIYRET